MFFGHSLISWSSKKHVVARSSTEVKYRSLPHTSSEICHVQSLLKEIHHCPKSTSVIWCDNLSALSVAANLVFHSRTKHVELDVHFIRDKVVAKELDVHYVPSTD